MSKKDISEIITPKSKGNDKYVLLRSSSSPDVEYKKGNLHKRYCNYFIFMYKLKFLFL